MLTRTRYGFLWLLGFSTAFSAFRYAIPGLNLLYGVLIVGLLATTVVILSLGTKRGFSHFVLAKALVIILALLASVTYGGDFFVQNLVACLPLLALLGFAAIRPVSSEFEAFFNGLKVSLVLDFAYSLVQLVVYQVQGTNINTLFLPAIGLDLTGLPTAGSRITGLIWDPYVLGIFCAVGFFLFRSTAIRLVTVVLLLYSGSRAGMVGLFAGLVVTHYKSWMKPARLALLMLAVLTLALLAPLILNATSLDRGFEETSSGWRRVEYFALIPEIWKQDTSLLGPLLGGAPYFSGGRFYYSGVESITNTMQTSPFWGIESDWSSILLGRGIVGLLVYMTTFTAILAWQRDLRLKAIGVAIFFAGVGYSYDLALFTNVLIWLALPSAAVQQRPLALGQRI